MVIEPDKVGMTEKEAERLVELGSAKWGDKEGTNKEIQTFLDQINKFVDLWNSLEIRVFAAKIGKDWLNLGSVFFLNWKRQDEISFHPPLQREDELKIIHKVDAPGNLLQYLEGLGIGKLRINDIEIIYGRVRNAVIVPYSFYLRPPKRNRDEVFPEERDFKVLTLEGYNDSLMDVLGDKYGRLNNSLKTNTPHFSNFRGVANDFLKSHYPLDDLYAHTFFEVLAPVPIRLGDQCRAEKNTLLVHSEAQIPVNGSDLRLNLTKRSAYEPRTEKFEISGKKANRMGDKDLIWEIDLQRGSSYEVDLIFRDDQIDSLTIKALSTSPRVVLHEIWDENYEIIDKLLSEKTKKTSKGKKPIRNEEFEIAVSLLLYLCGFSSGHYGTIAEYGEGVDILAFSSNDKFLLAGECTVEFPDKKGKLQNFYKRVQELKDHTDLEVVPVLFTRLPLNKIPLDEKNRAGQNKISILSNERIQRLLSMARKGSSVKEYHEFFKNPEPLDLEYISAKGVQLSFRHSRGF